jgi:hypothetical protein
MLRKIVPFVIAGLIATPVLAEQYQNQYQVVGVGSVGVTTQPQPTYNPKQNVPSVSQKVRVPVWLIVAPVAPTTRTHSLSYGYGGGHWRGRGPGWGPRYGPYGPGPDLGSAVVGGIIGGGIVSWLNRPEPPPPPPPPPEPEPAPPPQGASAVVLDPFTGPWYEWCAGKYKSFDAKTGTWTDNDGQKHFCGQ